DAAQPLRDGLRDAAERRARRVVVVSSARVYGAWPDNPVPIAEDRPLRPNPGCARAAQCAEGERVAQEWQEATGIDVAVLRPADAVTGQRPRRLRGVSVPRQFLHPDDLQSAIDHVVASEVAGIFN